MARYGCAVIGVTVAIVLRLLLDPVLGSRFTFSFSYMAVLVAAWYGGLRPALLATVLSAVATDYFILPPRFSMVIEGTDQQLGVAFFIMLCIGIALLGGSMHKARKEAEASAESGLRKERDKFEKIVTTVPVVICSYRLRPDGTTSFAYANPGLRDIYGFSPEELENDASSIFSVIHPEDLPKIRALIEESARHMTVWNCEYRVRHATRGEIWVEGHSVPTKEADGSILWQGYIADVTERKKVEETVRDRERLLGIVTSSARVGLVVVDGNYQYKFANEAYGEIFGVKPDEIVGRRVPEVLTTAWAQIQPNLDKALAGERVAYELTLPPVNGGRVPRCYSVVYEPRKSSANEATVVVVVVDISDIKRAEDARREVEGRLRQSQEVARIGSFEWNLQTQEGACTSEMEVIYGLEPGTFPKSLDGWQQLIHPDDRELARAYFDRASETGKLIEFEWRVSRRDGSTGWVGGRFQVFKDKSGKPLKLAGISADISARKQAESARIESEARYRKLFEYAPDGIIMADAQGNYSDGNERMCNMLGYTHAELITLNAKDIVAPEEIEHIEPALDTITANKPYHREWKFRRKDGSTFPADVLATLMPDGSVLAMIRDISDRKRAERRTMAQHAVTRILAASPSVDDASAQILQALCQSKQWKRGEMWRMDAEAKVLRFFKSWQSPNRFADLDSLTKGLVFTSGEGLPGRVWASAQAIWIPDVATDAAVRRREVIVQAGFRGAVGFPLTLGSEILGVLLFFNDELAQPDDDLVRMMMAIGSQIGQFIERKRAETAFQQQHDRMEGIVNSAMDGIITIDDEQRIILVNAAAERMFKCSAADTVGQNVERFIPQRFRQGHAQHVRNFGQTGIAARAMGQFGPISGVRSDGEEFPIEASISQITVEGRKLFTVTCRDVTERMRATETRLKLEELLRQAQKMEAFGQLAGGVSHDFNNLLTVISGYGEMLQGMLPDSDPKRKLIDEICSAGDRATSLTRQLLAFSRQQVLEPKVVNLNVVVSDTENLLRRLIGEDISLTTVLRPGISSVKVDPGQIEQVVMNLAVNARDAMPQGGKLTIETNNIELDETYVKTHPDARPGRFVQVAVSDTGTGMPAEVRARIFEPFFTTKGVGKGTGLGLAVVHGIIKQSGGLIEVYSEVGSGTTFKIFLPAVTEKPASATESGQKHAVIGPETILLVEDSAGVRDLAANSLTAFGYTVLTAPDGHSALKLMEEQQPKVDLMVTDVVMPEMSGRQLAETMRLRYPELKVLFVSGYTDDAVVRHGILQAEVAFLQKPFTPTSLAKKVREVLDQE